MADVDKKTLEKLRKLHETVRELQARTDEVLQEIGKLLNGGDGIGELLKTLERRLSDVWKERYHSPYLWQYTKDRPQMKRLLKTLTVEQIVDRWITYIADNDPFYVSARHGFGLFVSQVNRFAPEGTAGDFDLTPAPADCRHLPRCTSDQEHTRRKAAEMRA